MALLLALLVPVAIGFVVVTALWPADRRPDQTFLLKACLALGWGLGVASWTFFLWLVVAGALEPGLWVAEAAILGLLLAGSLVLLRFTRPTTSLPATPGSEETLPRLLTTAFVLVVFARGAQIVGYNVLYPHGHGDAYFIWNLKARFLYRGGEDWRLIFTFPNPDDTKPPASPPDYPLLLPATVARAWWYRGIEATRDPALIALAFTIGGYLLLYAAVTALRGRGQGAVAGLALAATPLYAFLGSAQVADVPLSFYMLAAVALFALHDAAGGASRRWVVLAGMMAGLAGWTKNEGLLFLVVLFFTRLTVVAPRRGLRAAARESAAFLAGLLPFACLLGYYKVALVPETNYLLEGQGGQTTLDRLTDWSRYRLVVAALVLQLIPGFQAHWSTIGYIVLLAPIYRLLLGRAPADAWQAAVTARRVVLLMLLGYVSIYLTTPLGLQEHLKSSLHRVLMHLWPLALFWFALAIASPEEALARDLSGPNAPPEPLADPTSPPTR